MTKQGIWGGRIVVGAVFQTNNYGSFEVINIASNRFITIRFIDTGWITTVESSNIRKGHVRDRMRPDVCIHGFVGVGPHYPRECNKSYSVWHSMMRRCYSPQLDCHKINYADVEVSPEWFNYQVFADWYEEKIKIYKGSDIQTELDKDLLVPGNRIYSASTCCIVPAEVNKIIKKFIKTNENTPLGVRKNGNGYAARMSVNGRFKCFGTYSTVAEAQHAYWRNKFRVIQETAIRYWHYLPEPLAYRLLLFNWSDALAYYGDDARIWSE